MTQDAILDVIHVMWETAKLLLLGISMLVVMVIFMILIVLFVSSPFPIYVQILGMVGLLLIFAGIIFELMFCAGNDDAENEDNDSDVDNNSNGNNDNRVVIVIEDCPAILDGVLDHAFDIDSDDDDDDGYDSVTDGDAETMVDAIGYDRGGDTNDDDDSSDDDVSLDRSCAVILYDALDGFSVDSDLDW